MKIESMSAFQSANHQDILALKREVLMIDRRDPPCVYNVYAKYIMPVTKY